MDYHYCTETESSDGPIIEVGGVSGVSSRPGAFCNTFRTVEYIREFNGTQGMRIMTYWN